MTAPRRTRLAVRVEYHAQEAPRRFFIGQREIAVTDTLDRWLDPEHSYFKLRGSDGGIYILRHEVRAGLWELILFDSGTREETRLSST
jgi:hypothetical protein